jgi:hypothetical protein
LRAIQLLGRPGKTAFPRYGQKSLDLKKVHVGFLRWRTARSATRRATFAMAILTSF